MTTTTTTPHRFTLDELDVLDVMAPRDEVALLMMDLPELLWDACSFYLHHRPDRWAEIAEHYYSKHN